VQPRPMARRSGPFTRTSPPGAFVAADTSCRMFGSCARNASSAASTTAKAIESYTAATPSGLFLSLAVGSMALSAMKFATFFRPVSIIIGQWAPTILITGLYNKLVKVEGSEYDVTTGPGGAARRRRWGKAVARMDRPALALEPRVRLLDDPIRPQP